MLCVGMCVPDKRTLSTMDEQDKYINDNRHTTCKDAEFNNL